MSYHTQTDKHDVVQTRPSGAGHTSASIGEGRMQSTSRDEDKDIANILQAMIAKTCSNMIEQSFTSDAGIIFVLQDLAQCHHIVSR
jgi:hypothetical protein